MSGKLTRIDATILADHSKLHAGDECYFWREYTSGRNYDFGPGNDLISNLKKKPSRSSAAELRHKNRVISECSDFFRGAINPAWLASATLVPIPGSKTTDHADFDDRMSRIINGIRSQPALDVRHLLRLTVSMQASHDSAQGERATVDDLLAAYVIDETVALPAPTAIGLFDDVLTAGVHYRASHALLQARFPGVPIVGFFVARRVFPPSEDMVPTAPL